jgi:hypothetical protein
MSRWKPQVKFRKPANHELRALGTRLLTVTAAMAAARKADHGRRDDEKSIDALLSAEAAAPDVVKYQTIPGQVVNARKGQVDTCA